MDFDDLIFQVVTVIDHPNTQNRINIRAFDVHWDSDSLDLYKLFPNDVLKTPLELAANIYGFLYDILVADIILSEDVDDAFINIPLLDSRFIRIPRDVVLGFMDPDNPLLIKEEIMTPYPTTTLGDLDVNLFTEPKYGYVFKFHNKSIPLSGMVCYTHSNKLRPKTCSLQYVVDGQVSPPAKQTPLLIVRIN